MQKIWKAPFRNLAAAGIFLVAAGFQINAVEGEVSDLAQSTLPFDVPTSLPWVQPIEIDLEAERSLQANATNSVQTFYLDIGQQLEALSDAAYLAFHGHVIDVEYKQEQQGKNDSYPSTYITFSIESVIHGASVANNIVLKFSGVGYIPPETFVSRSDLPIFSKDDEVVLFLVEGRDGAPKYLYHFFVLEEEIYDSDSHKIVRDDRDIIRLGPFHPQPRILERRAGPGTAAFIRKHVNAIDTVAATNAQSQSPRDLAPGYWPLIVQDFVTICKPRCRSTPSRPQTE